MKIEVLLFGGSGQLGTALRQIGAERALGATLPPCRDALQRYCAARSDGVTTSPPV